MAGNKNKPENPLADSGRAGKLVWGLGDAEITRKSGEKRTCDGRPKERRDDE